MVVIGGTYGKAVAISTATATSYQSASVGVEATSLWEEGLGQLVDTRVMARCRITFFLKTCPYGILTMIVTPTFR